MFQPNKKPKAAFCFYIIATEIDKFHFEICKQIKDLLSKFWNFDFRLSLYAGVLELADKQASDTCVFNMRVQVPSPAPWRVFLQHLKCCRTLAFFISQLGKVRSLRLRPFLYLRIPRARVAGTLRE